MGTSFTGPGAIGISSARSTTRYPSRFAHNWGSIPWIPSPQVTYPALHPRGYRPSEVRYQPEEPHARYPHW